jgi:hypothetical protein
VDDPGGLFKSVGFRVDGRLGEQRGTLLKMFWRCVRSKPSSHSTRHLRARAALPSAAGQPTDVTIVAASIVAAVNAVVKRNNCIQ